MFLILGGRTSDPSNTVAEIQEFNAVEEKFRRITSGAQMSSIKGNIPGALVKIADFTSC